MVRHRDLTRLTHRSMVLDPADAVFGHWYIELSDILRSEDKMGSGIYGKDEAQRWDIHFSNSQDLGCSG